MAKDSNDMIFNNVFQTMKIDCPGLIIPLANELHGTTYAKEEEVSLNHNEHFRKRQAGLTLRSTDSNLLIGSGEDAERYHFECQRRPDGTMIRRMVEYDMLIAVEDGQASAEGMQIKMPRSAVIYLEHTKNTPDEIQLKVAMSEVDGLHRIPSLKVQNYSVDELFLKKLYMLIPFYILVYKNGKMGYNEDEETITELQKIYADIVLRLGEAVENGNIEEFERQCVLDMTARIAEYELAEHEKLGKVIGDILLGGIILDYRTKDIYCDGRDAGITQGIAQGALDMCIKLLKQGEISMATAMAQLDMTEDELKACM